MSHFCLIITCALTCVHINAVIAQIITCCMPVTSPVCATNRRISVIHGAAVSFRVGVNWRVPVQAHVPISGCVRPITRIEINSPPCRADCGAGLSRCTVVPTMREAHPAAANNAGALITTPVTAYTTGPVCPPECIRNYTAIIACITTGAGIASRAKICICSTIEFCARTRTDNTVASTVINNCCTVA